MNNTSSVFNNSNNNSITIDDSSSSDSDDKIKKNSISTNKRSHEDDNIDLTCRNIKGMKCEVSKLPFKLLKTADINEKFNKNCLLLSDIISGFPLWVVLSNYLIDSSWLMSAAPVLRNVSEVLCFHGGDDITKPKYKPSNFKCFKPLSFSDYGTHHTKSFLIFYDTGIRVCVMTANLLYCDFNCMTQGVWVQDFPFKSSSSPQSSDFETQLITYYSEIENHTSPPWTPNLTPFQGLTLIDWIKKFDFSSANCRLLISVPGRHTGRALNLFGHNQLRTMLESEKFSPEFIGSNVVAQFSSLGSLGKDMKWLHEFSLSLYTGSTQDGRKLGQTNVELVLPTEDEVGSSVEGYASGQSMPVSDTNAQKVERQLWRKWGGKLIDEVGREKVCPHLKSYVRYNPDGKIAWFCLTSSNLSQAAWGVQQKKNSQLTILSWEMGVLFVPSLMLSSMKHPNANFSCTPNETSFSSLSSDLSSSPPQLVEFMSLESMKTRPNQQQQVIYFPIPYPLPPIPYQPNDVPWMCSQTRQKKDRFGRINEIISRGDKLYPDGNRLYGHKQLLK